MSLSGADRDEPVAAFDRQYFKVLEAIEDLRFWFRARSRILRTLVSEIVAEIGPGRRILEIGCGNGSVLRCLRDARPEGAVVGMDLFTEAPGVARARADCDVVMGDIGFAPFTRSFNMIEAFDVLEHLPNDVEALQNMRDLLVDGGRLLVTVPAHRALWSYLDAASHQCRRCDIEDLRSKLQGAGFCVTFLTYYMAAMYPIICAGRKMAGFWGRRHVAEGRVHEIAAHDFRIVPGVNAALTRWLEWECLRVSRHHKLPFGASLLAIAEAA